MDLREIIDAGYNTSQANDPDVSADDSELVTVIDLRQKELFARAAEINPWFFSTSATISPVSNAWNFTSNLLVPIRVETAAGAKVHIVPVDDRTDGAFAPRVYRLGRKLYSVGETDDPDDTSDDLTIFYAYSPVDLDPDASPTGQTLDTNWPTPFDGLLVLQVGRFLSIKDESRPSLAPLDDLETRLLERFEAHVGGTEIALERRVAIG